MLAADCRDAHFRPKTGAFSAENEKKRKQQIRFHPKTKLAKTSRNPHFRSRKRKRKRNLVGL